MLHHPAGEGGADGVGICGIRVRAAGGYNCVLL